MNPRSGTTEQGFILPAMVLFWGKIAILGGLVAGAYFWHSSISNKALEKAREEIRTQQSQALASALLAQKEQDNANQALLQDHIRLLARSRNSSLLDAQATARAVANNASSLDGLLDSIARSDANCRARLPLPANPASGPSSPPPGPGPGDLFPDCASTLLKMAEDADASTNRIRALQGYIYSLTPFFGPKP
jgi:hypothetical protein